MYTVETRKREFKGTDLKEIAERMAVLYFEWNESLPRVDNIILSSGEEDEKYLSQNEIIDFWDDMEEWLIHFKKECR